MILEYDLQNNYPLTLNRSISMGYDILITTET